MRQGYLAESQWNCFRLLLSLLPLTWMGAQNGQHFQPLLHNHTGTHWDGHDQIITAVLGNMES